MPSETRRAQYAVRGLQAGIGAVLVAGVALRSPGVVVNAALALAVTFLPGVLERDLRLALDPRLTLLVAAAVFLHSLGMLRLYDSVWWWDHLTHTFSASLVAAAGYAATRALDQYSDAVRFTPRFLVAFTLLFTLALGVFWEVLEFAARGAADALGVEPVLIQYGLEDTLLDLVFDAGGALLAAAFGARHLSPTVDALVARLRTRGGEESAPDGGPDRPR